MSDTSLQASGTQGSGSWQGRPAGVPGAVPPPSVPLAFFAAAALGLAACGVTLALAGTAAAGDPTADPVVAAAHFGLLATLSTGVLGAMHQFVPVVTGRPLRSIRLAWMTFASWTAASWSLPLGFALGHEWLIGAGGGLAGVAFAVILANLSAPLSVRGKGMEVVGLRLALVGLALTGGFGLVFLVDRSGRWFELSGHVVLAHALVGLFWWLGLSYVAVAEKLWPMFFLAHLPGRHRAGSVAVLALPAGVALAAPGVLLGIVPLAAAGAALAGVGLVAHLVSLATYVAHRRRRADLHLAYVLTSAAWLPVGAGFALAGAFVLPGDEREGVALVAASVAAFAGWLLEALVGHAHKVVPFVVWTALRSRGVTTGPSGRPLAFADLYSRRAAGLSHLTVTTAVAALCAGLAGRLPAATVAAGALLAVTGLVTAVNLSLTPLLMLKPRRLPSPELAGEGGSGSTRCTGGDPTVGDPARSGVSLRGRRTRARSAPARCAALVPGTPS